MTKVSAKTRPLPDFMALTARAKNGSEADQLEILQCFKKLAFKLIYQSGANDRLGEDALQIARLGILKAIYDWREGDDIHRFVAFVTNKMRTELHTAMRRQVAAETLKSGSGLEDAAMEQDAQVYRDYLLSEGQIEAVAGARGPAAAFWPADIYYQRSAAGQNDHTAE